MKKITVALTFLGASWIVSSTSSAVPVLQVGALTTNSSEGTYVNYTTQGEDKDTAFINGGTLVTAGVYQQKDVVWVGGKYNSSSDDWSDLGFNPIFDGHGAILVATVFEGWDSTDMLNIFGATFIKSMDTLDSALNTVLTNHYPVSKPGFDYLFFDIGDFKKITNSVVDLNNETGSADGEIKTFALNISGFEMVHFDLLALETSVDDKNIGGVRTRVYSTDASTNPGSHDVTYQGPSNPIPEPATMLLFGAGIAGLAGIARRKRN